MKKILLMAMVAFAFMACNGNGADAPSKDQKAIDAATVQAPSLIGQAPEAVDKALVKAGFTQADVEFAKVAKRHLPARAPQMQNAEEPVEVVYLYNITEDIMENEDQSKSIAYVNSVLAKGDCIVIAMAMYLEDKLAGIACDVMVPMKDSCSLIYTTVSDGLFKQMPKIDNVYATWQGQVGKEMYTDHAAFVAALAAAKAVEANEMGSYMEKGYCYVGHWGYPDEAEIAARQAKNEGIFAECSMFVIDLAHMDLMGF